MLSQETKRKIKFLQIRTRRLLSGTLIGDHSSAIKGTGLEFDQIREYQQGDDVRFVDWKSSARMNKLLVKQYFEERNRTIILMIDISASTIFSSSLESKQEIISKVAGVLALVADYGKDNVGLLLFSDKVKKFIPPARGKKHLMNLMEEIFTFKNTIEKTNIDAAFEYVAKNIKKNSIIFIISDFLDDGFESSLKILSKKHEIIAIRCLDKTELFFPNVGMLNLIDIETGQKMLINACPSKTKNLNHQIHKNNLDKKMLFSKQKINLLDLKNDQDFLPHLIWFFKQLMTY